MSEYRTVRAERLIAASPGRIFAELADPYRHAALDGSGTIEAPAQAPPRLGLGAEFSMQMRQFGLCYRSFSTVVEYEQKHVITRQTVGRWRGRTIIGGQRWRYHLTPMGPRTLVQHSFLWGRARLPILTIWLPGYTWRAPGAMLDTLARLAAVVEDRA